MKICYFIIALGLSASGVFAGQNDYAEHIAGLWSDTRNWSVGLPDPDDVIRLKKNAEVTLKSAAQADIVEIGIFNDSMPSTLNVVEGGFLTFSTKMRVGAREGGTGLLHVNGGHVSSTIGHLIIGGDNETANVTGSVTVSNNGALSLAGKDIRVGAGGSGCSGILTIETGARVNQHVLTIGNDTGSTGLVNLGGGELTINCYYAHGIEIAPGSTLNITDGVLKWKYTNNQKSDDIQALIGKGLTFADVTRTDMEFSQTAGAFPIGHDEDATLWAFDDGSMTHVWATVGRPDSEIRSIPMTKPESKPLGLISACGVFGVISRRVFPAV